MRNEFAKYVIIIIMVILIFTCLVCEPLAQATGPNFNCPNEILVKGAQCKVHSAVHNGKINSTAIKNAVNQKQKKKK